MKKYKLNYKLSTNIIGGLIIIFLLLSTIMAINIKQSTKISTHGEELIFTPVPAKSNLQLYSFTLPSATLSAIPVYPTIALIPPIKEGSPQQPGETACGIANPILIRGSENGRCCVQDGPVNNPSECCSGVPYCDLTKNPPVGSPGIDCECGSMGSKQSLCVSGNKPAPYWCNAKPVIYLYPVSKTKVDIIVEVPGEIFVSIPEYKEEGWRDVVAYPDGRLFYEGQTYNELYYESSITPIDPPNRGKIVSKSDLRSSLVFITSRLGLNNLEQAEFLAYWMPRLMKVDKQYIQLSVFTPEEKELIDRVKITPVPDTFIQFIMYFKGLEEIKRMEALELPEITPQRKGFTAVEWGGILDE